VGKKKGDLGSRRMSQDSFRGGKLTNSRISVWFVGGGGKKSGGGYRVMRQSDWPFLGVGSIWLLGREILR